MNARAAVSNPRYEDCHSLPQRRRAYVPQQPGSPAGIMNALALMCRNVP